MQSSHPTTPKVIGALAVAVVIGVGGFLLISGANARPSGSLTSTSSSSSSAPATSTATTTPTPTVVAPTPASTPASQVASAYKDGTYNATSNYYVPGGQNSIAVTLTIANDTITAVKTSSTVDSYQSQQYVDSFNSSINSAVVGTPLTNAYQNRVGGASLTTIAFDDTLQTIMNNAKA